MSKVTIPGKKESYRLYGVDGTGLVDVLLAPKEAEPKARQRLLIRNPFVVSFSGRSFYLQNLENHVVIFFGLLILIADYNMI